MHTLPSKSSLMQKTVPHRAVGPALLNASQSPKFMDILRQLLPNTLQMGRQDNLGHKTFMSP